MSRCAAAAEPSLAPPLATELQRVLGVAGASGTSGNAAAGGELSRAAVFVVFEAMVDRAPTPTDGDGRVTAGGREARRPLGDRGIAELVSALTARADAPEPLACQVLSALRDAGLEDRLLRPLVDAAAEIASSSALTRNDLLGRLYQRVLLVGGGPSYATYYTSLPAARLLAGLVFAAGTEVSRSAGGTAVARDVAAPGVLPTVLDPACGSGALLSAAYAALRAAWLAPNAGGSAWETFHRLCLEEALHGWDVMPFGAHLARSTLRRWANGSGNPAPNILTLAAGLDADGAIRLGALDALRSRSTGDGSASVPCVPVLTDEGRVTEAEVPAFDVVIMNPPFSRSANPGVKFGYSDARTKALMDARLRSMTKELGVGGIGHAGLAAYFVVLAHRLLKAGGRLAVVLPRSSLSGVSWAGVRDLILRQYQLEYIIANADAGDDDGGVEPWNWSEQTDLGEVMWVARKADPGPEREPVRYVNLWAKPRDEGASVALASQLSEIGRAALPSLAHGDVRTLAVDGAPVGAVYSVPQDELKRNWLFPCLFASPRLNALAVDWVMRPPFETVALGGLVAGVGPDIAQVKRAFARANGPTRHAILWGHQGAMNTMALPDELVGHGETAPGGRGGALHAAHAATLLIAERPHLHSEALLSVEVSTPVLSTAFWEVWPAAPALAVLVHLWLQSTFGFVCFLANATSSRGDIFKLKKGQLVHIPVVGPETVSPAAARALYEEVCSVPWRRFPDEFARAAGGEGPRKAIDDFFIERLGLGIDLRPYYELLAADPVVTARRVATRG